MRDLLKNWSRDIEQTGAFSGNREVQSGLEELSEKFRRAAAQPDIPEEIDVQKVLKGLNFIFHILECYHLDEYQVDAVRERAIVFNLIKVAKGLPACAESEEFIRKMEDSPNYSMQSKFIVALRIVKGTFEEALKMILANGSVDEEENVEPLDFGQQQRQLEPTEYEIETSDGSGQLGNQDAPQSSNATDPDMLISSDVYLPRLLQLVKNLADQFPNFDKGLVTAAENIEKQETKIGIVRTTLKLTFEDLFDPARYTELNNDTVALSVVETAFLEISEKLRSFYQYNEEFRAFVDTAMDKMPESNAGVGIEVKDVEKGLWNWIGTLM